MLSETTTHTADTAASQNLAKVTMRTKRRHSERPWSVSCLSQLTQINPTTRSNEEIANQGLANHSISESALNTISSPVNESPSGGSGGQTTDIKNADSKTSLKRRKMRFRKRLAVSISRVSHSLPIPMKTHFLPHSYRAKRANLHQTVRTKAIATCHAS